MLWGVCFVQIQPKKACCLLLLLLLLLPLLLPLDRLLSLGVYSSSSSGLVRTEAWCGEGPGEKHE